MSSIGLNQGVYWGNVNAKYPHFLKKWLTLSSKWMEALSKMKTIRFFKCFHSSL